MSTSSMGTEQTNTSLNVKEPMSELSSTELKQTNEQFQDSPIFIRGNEKSGYFGTIGQYKMTETYENLYDLITELENPSLALIIRIMTIMIESASKLLKWDEQAKQTNTPISNNTSL